MVSEVLHFLNPKHGVFLDLTLGYGGHARAILDYGDAKLIAIDRDEEAVKFCQDKLRLYGDRAIIHHQNFRNIETILNQQVNGILMDLGPSTHQLKAPYRGLSIAEDGPLDMRMDRSQQLMAADIVDNYSEKELADLLFSYGEEYFAKRIARNIISFRKQEKIVTTKVLENIVFHSYPASKRHGRIHPATKSFQALRIAVNDELNCLQVIPRLAEFLLPGGRLIVISFHSLEDRIAKHSLANLPAPFRVVTKKPIMASATEVEQNPRCRSAKLRVLENSSR
jgi:16S rRNA (cytosine1402-N4)-methyltransferase